MTYTSGSHGIGRGFSDFSETVSDFSEKRRDSRKNRRAVRRSRPPDNLRHELYAGRALRTTCATSCTPVASSRQLAPRVVRRSRPPDNLRRELYAGRILSFMAGL